LLIISCWKQVEEGRAKRHCVDHEFNLGEFEPDDLEEIAGAVRADRKHPWRIRFCVKVDDDESVVDSMVDRSIVVAMFEG